ncbi:DUF4279 domain-containing protein [Ureibacillus sp. FSL E2-3493]|uniref:DUF4279 domain-containing protein n=1 Tax=Ureibacillus sp. FSL E2-3493 TaxID=2921367 RepID=UPI0031197938
MKEVETTISVYYSISGDDFPLEEFTKKVGITPTDAFRKGETIVIGKNKHIKSKTTWEFGSELELTDEPLKQIRSIVDPLQNSVDIINQFKVEFNLTNRLVIVIYMGDTPPGLIFDSKVIEFVHNVGAQIECDIYKENFYSDI